MTDKRNDAMMEQAKADAVTAAVDAMEAALLLERQRHGKDPESGAITAAAIMGLILRVSRTEAGSDVPEVVYRMLRGRRDARVKW